MMRTLPAVTASLLLIAAGLVHGFWTDRWAPSNAATEAAARLDAIPLEIGEWRGEALEAKITPAMGNITGFVQRRYVNRRTRQALTISLVCGRPGPVSIHPPDVCYGASGYEVGARTREKIGAAGEFFTADATKANAIDETRLRLYWSWGDGKNWTAPNNPRFTFVCGRLPVLYKLYVLRSLAGPEETKPDEPCQAFLKVLLPELERSLFAPGS
jgi:hypothetical protein